MATFRDPIKSCDGRTGGTTVAEVRAQDEDAPRARTLLSGGDDDGVCGGRDGGPEYL